MLLKFKKSKPHIDQKIDKKKTRSQIQKLIKKEKRNFYEFNFEQKINKPKELCKTFKFYGLTI